MSRDLLTLQLDTAKALGWTLDEPRSQGDTGYACEVYSRNGERTFFVQYRGETIVGFLYEPPDYPADLGACAEVLEAIKARGWWWKAWSCDDHAVFMIYTDGEEYGPLSTNADGPLPAAICEAFCQAVEASRE